MTTGSVPNIGTSYAATAPAAPTHDTLTHLERRLAKEDIAFLNVRGVRGRPDIDKDRLIALAKRVYADPTAPDKINPPAYFRGEPVQDKESQIESTNRTPGHRSVDRQAEAIMEDRLYKMMPTTEIPSRQMTALLEEAKLVIFQRGVDGEAQVTEAIEVIDTVLRNIQGFEKAGTSEQSGKFAGVYSHAVKEACELAVGNGRDPYPLIDKLPHCHETVESFDKKFELAMESVRPQARFMAEELKNILRPYAQISPPDAETRGEATKLLDETPGRASTWWQKA